ncbi:hypothetical protein HKX48_008985 [Thoreauomyces humboldtii]|nr:hypothetical protein HKX48_008985 [Thoreauomyces humboldtii]
MADHEPGRPPTADLHPLSSQQQPQQHPLSPSATRIIRFDTATSYSTSSIRRSPTGTSGSGTASTTTTTSTARQRHAHRRTSLLFTLEVILTLLHFLTLIVLLSIFHTESCDVPLRGYLVALVVLTLAHSFPWQYVQWNRRRSTARNSPLTHENATWFLLLRKLWGLCSVVDAALFVAANVMLVKTDDCKNVAPRLYWMVVGEVVLMYATAVLPLLCFLILIVVFRKHIARHRQLQNEEDGGGGGGFMTGGLTTSELANLKTMVFGLASSNTTNTDTTDVEEAVVPITTTTTTTTDAEPGLPPIEHDSCSVCFEDYVQGDILRELPCRHRFHRTCIDAWLLPDLETRNPGHRTCPLCVADAAGTKGKGGDDGDATASAVVNEDGAGVGAVPVVGNDILPLTATATATGIGIGNEVPSASASVSEMPLGADSPSTSENHLVPSEPAEG